MTQGRRYKPRTTARCNGCREQTPLKKLQGGLCEKCRKPKKS